MKHGSLFPEIDREVLDDRMAQRREQVQRARDYLRNRDLSWLINRLLDKGPVSEVALIMSLMDELDTEEFSSRVGDVLRDLNALWLCRKLWRRPLGIHAGSGEQSYLFGIRKVHSHP